MSDKVLNCKNCYNPFVYSEYEQSKDAKDNKNEPHFCPICTAIKMSESKHPPKPKKTSAIISTTTPKGGDH